MCSLWRFPGRVQQVKSVITARIPPRLFYPDQTAPGLPGILRAPGPVQQPKPNANDNTTAGSPFRMVRYETQHATHTTRSSKMQRGRREPDGTLRFAFSEATLCSVSGPNLCTPAAQNVSGTPFQEPRFNVCPRLRDDFLIVWTGTALVIGRGYGNRRCANPLKFGGVSHFALAMPICC
jgi:hypothetical protein